jgi:CP family cyanate transporter-like MFS transporter
VVWTLVAMFGLLGIGFYGLSLWLPDAYVERGWSEGSAGALLAVFQVASIPGGLAIAAAADRHGSRRRYLVALAALQVLSILGILLLPGGGFAWAALFGLGNGGLFSLIMTLPLDVADDPADVGAAAALMLGAGYVISALSPFVLGAVRDATGSFTGPLWVVVGTAAVMLLLGSTLTRERLHRGLRTGELAA